MAFATLTVLVLLGMALVAGLFVYMTVRNARQWRQKMEDILLPIGFAPVACASERSTIEQALVIVNAAHQGKRLLKVAYRRVDPCGQYVIYVCDYYFSSASGKASAGNWLLVCLISDALSLPRFSVQTLPESARAISRKLFELLAQRVAMPGMHPISAGDAGLELRLQVYAHDDNGAMPLPRALLDGLVNCAGGASLDANANTLVLSNIGMMADQVRQELDAKKLQNQIQLAGRIFATVTG